MGRCQCVIPPSRTSTEYFLTKTPAEFNPPPPEDFLGALRAQIFPLFSMFPGAYPRIFASDLVLVPDFPGFAHPRYTHFGVEICRGLIN